LQNSGNTNNQKFLVILEEKMINNSKEALSIIVNLTKELIPDSRVLLFGSRARQNYSDTSDYDFLIITKEAIDVERKRLYKSILRKKLAKQKIPADILIQSEEEIQEKKLIIGHIVREIIREGILI